MAGIYTCKPTKFAVYDNKTAKKSMEAVKKETGCDVICNGYLYNMTTREPVCNIVLDGKVLSDDGYTYNGYAWNDGELPVIQAGAGQKKNFISCSALVKDGKALTLYSSTQNVKRGRTAIGFKKDGTFVLWCSTDADEPKTLKQMRQIMLDAGCDSAIALDGGGSSSCITPNETIKTSRIVTSYICVWEDTPDTTETEENTMNIKTKLANKNNYGAKRNTSDIEYIVVHYTANDGDTDENNGKYFANNIVGASAHYFVDDDSVTQSVPDDYVAWHCGAKKYKHKTCRNANSISVELCDDVKNGTIYPSAKTIENALKLVRMLMDKYGIERENVIRHYDVTGKVCPAYWSGTTAKNKLWKTAFWNKLVPQIAVGSMVMVKDKAPTYTGGRLADFVYKRPHVVKSIVGNRVVITYSGVVVAAVHKDNLTLV